MEPLISLMLRSYCKRPFLLECMHWLEKLCNPASSMVGCPTVCNSTSCSTQFRISHLNKVHVWAYHSYYCFPVSGINPNDPTCDSYRPLVKCLIDSAFEVADEALDVSRDYTNITSTKFLPSVKTNNCCV